jgi:hypothetical protein
VVSTAKGAQQDEKNKSTETGKRLAELLKKRLAQNKLRRKSAKVTLVETVD